jgi:plastocyanin
MTRTAWIGCTFAAAAALTIVACGGDTGGSSPTSPTTPTTPPPAGTTITIGADGRVSPASLTVSPGTRVTFVNNHNRGHEMSSDPHPEHTDCPEVNQAGNVQPGQTRQTGNLNTVRTCGFHDHNEPDNANLRGTITIR